MKKVIFILVVALAALLGTMGTAHADSVAAHLVGTDGLNASYGLSLSTGNDVFYGSIEDLTNKGFETNTALAAIGVQWGPLSLGPVVGLQIKSGGTYLGLVGAELGLTADIAGPLFVRENNRVLRGAGGVSDGQVDLGLGIKF